MPLNAHSSEFARLVTAWLDGTATAEEAAQLWQAVAEDNACALEFAAAARFEALLVETVQERAVETKLRQELGTGPAVVKRSAHRPLTSLRPLALAAALAVLGITAWLLWPQAEAPQIAESPPPKPKTPAPAVSDLGPPIKRLAAVAPSAEEVDKAPEVPLPDRLDRFFLGSVALDQVPLQRALGLLQGQLLELNFLKADALKKLRITVPTEASGRRVTFHSGPISFLKAVRAVAALGGCDMTVDEPTLALILHRETFPQVPNKKDVRQLLASQIKADGKTAADDPKQVAALLADAASLGIKVDATKSLEDQSLLPMTRGQWLALQALTEARQQLSQFPVPSFQLYFTNENLGTDRVINQDEATQMQHQLQQDGGTQGVVVTPSLKSLPPSDTLVAGLTVLPVGEALEVTFTLPSGEINAGTTSGKWAVAGTSSSTDGEIVTAILYDNQAASLNIAGGSLQVDAAGTVGLTLRGEGTILKLGSAAGNAALTSGTTNSYSHLVIISGPPPSQPPPSSQPPP